MRRQHQAERDEGHFLPNDALDFLGDGFLGRQIRRGKPGIAQFLKLRHAGPAGPGIGAIAANGHVAAGHRDIQAFPGGAKGAPAALIDRAAIGPALDLRAPIHGNEIHVEADALHQIRGHYREVLKHGQIGGRHHHHAFILVA